MNIMKPADSLDEQGDEASVPVHIRCTQVIASRHKV